MSLLSTAAWDALVYIMHADPCDINSLIPTSSSSAKKTMDSSEPNQRLKAAQTNQQNAKHSASSSWLVLMMRTCSNTQPPTDKERTYVQCPVSTRNERSKANICSCFSRFPLQCAIGIARHHQQQHTDDQESHHPTSISPSSWRVSVCVKNKTNLYLLLCSSQCAQFVLVSSAAKHQEPEGAGWEK